MVQCEDPRIVAQSQVLAADQTSAWQVAEQLERWVFDHIDKKSMGVGFASASEVFEQREGDCSEHSVLLAALSRASGIPCRIVMGLVYVQGIFAAHAWNEVYLDDWYALDGSMATGGADATHLALMHTSLHEDDSMAGMAALSSSLGLFDLEVVEVRYGSQRYSADDLNNCHRIDGDHYRNELLGIAFQKPSDWHFEIPDTEGLTTRLVEMFHPADRDRVRLRALSVPYHFDVLDFLQPIRARHPTASPIESIQIAGRPAHRFSARDGQEFRQWVAILRGSTLFGFELKAYSPLSEALFLRLLHSLDFDVGTLNRASSASGADTSSLYWMFFRSPEVRPTMSQEQASAWQREHLGNLTRLYEGGQNLLAGPLGEAADLRGLVVLEMASLGELDAAFAPDPFVQNGQLEVVAYPWQITHGGLGTGEQPEGMAEYSLVLVERDPDVDPDTAGELYLELEQELQADLDLAVAGTIADADALCAVLIVRSTDREALGHLLQQRAALQSGELTARVVSAYFARAAIEPVSE
jgi:uncharacterized protein YciI